MKNTIFTITIIITSPFWISWIIRAILADILFIPITFLHNLFTDDVKTEYFTITNFLFYE